VKFDVRTDLGEFAAFGTVMTEPGIDSKKNGCSDVVLMALVDLTQRASPWRSD